MDDRPLKRALVRERRIDALLSESGDELMSPDEQASASPARRVLKQVGSLSRMLRFYVLDIRPAILARRKAPREDVISHLLAKGHTDLEILEECLTYATAGMVTTREFIGVATWHLLEDDALRHEYVTADQAARHRNVLRAAGAACPDGGWRRRS
jgi:cytochrome P450